MELILGCGSCLSLFALFLSVRGDDLESLRLVQILYRHGDRTPISVFPTDAWKDSWSEGLGELTNLGKQQQFELGKYYRTRYDGFLNRTYHPDWIYVRSTDKDRTLMSAMVNLAGLYPPAGQQVWNDNIPWQPIPVHTLPGDEDYEMNSDSVCAKYDEEFEAVKKSPEVVAFNKKHKELFAQLSNYTGLDVQDVFTMSDIYDVLFIEKNHNRTLPAWGESAAMQAKLKCLKEFWIGCKFKTRDQGRLKGGPLLGRMLRNMQDKIDGKIDAKQAFFYSGHDMTIIAMLTVLDLYEHIQPPYASSLMIELHEAEGNYSIKILYRNTTDVEPYELQLKNCTSPCPFTRFAELVAPQIPADIKKECATATFDDNIALISAITASILGCTLLMLIVAAYAFYRRNSDQYRYFNIHSDNI